MANNIQADGTVIVEVDSKTADVGISAIERRFMQLGTVAGAAINRINTAMNGMQRYVAGGAGSGFANFFNTIRNGAMGVTAALGGGGGGGATGAVNSFGSAISKTIGFLGGFYAIRGLIGLMTEFGNKMIEVNRVYTGFIASMSVIKGSVAAASTEYDWLVAVSNKMGASVEDSITQFHRLAASLKNVDSTGELTRHLFVGLSEAATVLHARGQDVSLMFAAVQQIASKGKLSLEELQKQLGNTLPGAMALAARSMMGSTSFMAKGITDVGAAERELRDQISKGTINAYEFLARFANQLKKEYGDGVEYASDKFTANFNRMRNSVFELYRTVGTSGAMDGLTKVVKELTGLFGDGQGGAAEGLGKGLGEMFSGLAGYLADLDAKDVVSFFAAFQGAITATTTVMDQLLGTVGKLTGDMDTNPLLLFVEMVSRAFAGLADVITGVALGLANLYNGANVALAGLAKASTAPGEIVGNAVDRTGAFFGITMPGKDVRDKNRQMAADASAWFQEAQVKNLNGMDASEQFVNGNNASTKVRDQFADAKARAAATKTGAKAGTTADLAAAYVNPLGDLDLQKQIETIMASSSAPNSSKKPKADPVQNNYLRETTRLLKAVSEAENEYDNIQDNRFRSQGKNETQMQSLMKTDERYIKLSDDKKAKLMEYAKQLDAVALRVDNLKKVQSAYFDSLQKSFDTEDRVKELQTTGFQSQFREEANTRNSFKRGGDNEFMDETGKNSLIQSSITNDMNDRLLSFEAQTAEIRNANKEAEFQAGLIGKSALEVDKLTKYRDIDLAVARLTVGASDEQIAKYRTMAEVLKDEVGTSLDEVYAKQTDAFSGMRQSLVSYQDEAKNFGSQFGDALTSTLGNLESAFEEFTTKGKISFSSLITSIMADLAKLAARQMISSVAGSLMGAFAGYGNAASGAQAVTSGTQGINQQLAGRFAKGGDFTNEIVSQPTLFRFANGSKMGEMGEAGPEAIMPLKRNKNGDLGVVVSGEMGQSVGRGGVVINNYGSDEVSAQPTMTQGDNGQMMEGWVINIVARDTMNGGKTARAQKSRFGLKEPS